MDDLSVIIPAYNASKTLATTLRSIVDQTVQPAEIIVIDDGSTDNTKDVACGFRQVKYIQQNNSGVSAARNNGVASSKSAWVAFCDADDVWHPQKIIIGQQVRKAIPSATFVFHDFYIFDSTGIVMERGTCASKTMFPLFSENKITMRDILKQSNTIELHGDEYKQRKFIEVLSGNAFEGLILGNFILPSTVMIRKDVYQNIGGFDTEFRVAEETEFFLRASKLIDYAYIDMPLTGYRRASGGLTGNLSRLITYGLKAFEKHCIEDAIAREKYSNNVKKGAAKRYSRMSYYYLSECQRSDAEKFAINSLRYNPFERRAWLSLVLSILPTYALRKLRRTKQLWTKKTY